MLLKNRLGQGLELNTIILAALGIIILIILIVIVQQRTAIFGTGVQKAGEATCAPDNEPKPLGTECDVIYANFKDLRSDQICCKRGTAK